MIATSLLTAEHKHILRALNVIEQMAGRVENGAAPDEGDTADILEFLRLFADDYHQRKEEAVLFPAMLRTKYATEIEPLRHMIFEHDQERSLVDGIEEALRTKKGADFVYYAHRLNDILRTHIYKEDHILFELADLSLSAEEDERVAADLDDFARSWVEEELGDLLKRLNGMEQKYLGRVA